MVEWLIQDACGRVRHAGNAEHAQAAVPRGDNFRHRGHADEVSADGSQIADLRRRFVTRPGEPCIDAFGHSDPQAVSFADGHLAKSSVIGVCHVMKTQAEPFVVGTSEWINALQIDVVADDYKPSLRELALDAAGGVRQDDRFHSHTRENSNRKHDFFC